MPDPLELTLQSFTTDKVEIKVKNVSSDVLSKSLVIELYVPSYLVSSKIKDAAKAAATAKKPVGVATLAGVVSGPEGWSVWAKRETSDSTAIIVLFNDLSQTGTDLATPVKVAAGAEFVIRFPLNPQASRAATNVLFKYQHGRDQRTDKPVQGKLELKASDGDPWNPSVTLSTNHPTPTMIPPGSPAKIMWEIKDGISATLRGPLPNGNNELKLETKLQSDFYIEEGYVEVLVISGMTYILQAEVKHPQGKANVQVVRMLTLDTSNDKYCYISPHPPKVLPYGLIEIDWAAWGSREVTISVSGHTTRTIELTQQTLGRFYEGSGVMRVIATKEVNKERTKEERIIIEGTATQSMTKPVEVRSWIPMEKPVFEGEVQGMAVIAPTMAVLTTHGLFVADVMMGDPTPPQTKLTFNRVAIPDAIIMWLTVTAVEQRFLCLRMLAKNGNCEILPFTPMGTPDPIPPVTLPADVVPVVGSYGALIDFVGVKKRAYFVAESLRPFGAIRIAYSVGFNSETQKADVRREPLLESLVGYRIVAFDKALFALNRKTGRMFRFDVTTSGTLEKPSIAASAIKKGTQNQSMVADGLLVPVGRMLVVMNPTAVPSIDSLEAYALQNTLSYTGTTTLRDDIPQDLVYNPLRDYWGRCGHDIDVTRNSCVAFRGGDSKRLWIIRDTTDLQTLTVSSESLFAHDYVRDFPSKPLPPYINKKRQFKITNSTGIRLLPMLDKFVKAGLRDFEPNGPAELTDYMPQTFRSGTTETFEFAYNETDTAPIIVRFLLEVAAGVEHEYVVEVSFSGADLSTATSVFKRIAVSKTNVMSIAEIPDTKQQYSTNNPIVIALPRRLSEGVKFRAQNATSYQLLKEVPQSDDRYERINRYSGEEIAINFNTPTFYLSAFGAGELDINVDFAFPPGIKISSGAQPQTKLVRINTDKSKGLHPELLPNQSETSFQCKVRYLLKQVLPYVHAGDGMATTNGSAIYLPVTDPQGQILMKVLKIDPENLSMRASSTIQSTNLFSTPNSVVVSPPFVFAMWGDTDIHVYDHELEYQNKVSVGDTYAAVLTAKGAYTTQCFWLGIKKDRTVTQSISSHYSVANKPILKSSGPNKIISDLTRDVSVDSVKAFRAQNRMAGFPEWVSSKTISPIALSPMSVSPGGDQVREVAVCIDGGLFVVGLPNKPIRALALESAGQEEGIGFGKDGKTIYCLHSQGENQGLRLSRVDNVALKQTHSLVLPRGEGVADLATDTRQRQAGTSYKSFRSTSMVVDYEEKQIFVSHGRTIFKIDVATMTVKETFTMELPCRVFHVWWGKPTQAPHPDYGSPLGCTLVYAIGATYRGNGMDSRDHKTHLYKLAVLDK
ncbi:MAG TPA: hypothetical protein VFS77_16200 [Pyrinomonadaceae bacterium]|nr:hypothetical protein [Pyrinomonadaceae bacterium]